MDNDNITKYYSSIDNDILNKLSKNTNIENNNIKNINKIITYLNKDKYIECYSNE